MARKSFYKRMVSMALVLLLVVTASIAFFAIPAKAALSTVAMDRVHREATANTPNNNKGRRQMVSKARVPTLTPSFFVEIFTVTSGQIGPKWIFTFPAI